MWQTLQRNILAVAAAALIGSSACSPATPTPIPVIDDPDPEFAAAVTEAHQTIGRVFKALLAPEPSYTFIGVRVRFVGADSYEDMWTEPIDYYNGKFTVEMVEGVTLEQGLHPEHEVRVPVEDVLDWMIVQDDGRLLGGYTIRLAYERMTPEEREEFIRITGYVMD